MARCPNCHEAIRGGDTDCPWKPLARIAERDKTHQMWNNIWDMLDERPRSKSLKEIHFHDFIRAILKGLSDQ